MATSSQDPDDDGGDVWAGPMVAPRLKLPSGRITYAYKATKTKKMAAGKMVTRKSAAKAVKAPAKKGTKGAAKKSMAKKAAKKAARRARR
jgi:hypothetical protein